jgi:hypothetical protein
MSREQYESHWKDYYQVLGVQCSANAKTIRRVWHQLSQIYHPDVAGDAEVNLARMQELNEAYEVLSDPYRRNRYDQAYQSRAKETSIPSPGAAPAAHPAPPPTSQRPQPEDPPPSPSERRRGLAGRTKLVAAAGAIAVLTLIAVAVMPGLLPGGDGPAAPQPNSFNPGPPTPLPGPALTPYPSEMPSGATTPSAGTEPTQAPEPTPTPVLAPTPTLAPRSPILVMSPEAQALGFRDFQVSGNPWMVDFSGECQEAPCLRSGTISGAGISILRLNLYDLPASARTISFDIKAASPVCCASFEIIMSAIAGLKPVTVNLPNSSSWTSVEVEVPSVRPPTITLEWEFWSGPSGLSGLDSIWIDNIQFK